MLSGLQVAGSIDGTVRQAQEEAAVIDREVSHLTDRLLQLADDQARAYQSLARIRLDEIRSGKLIRELSSADQRARELIEQRQAELVRLDQALAEANARVEELNQQREAARQRVEAVTESAQAAEAEVRAVLEQDPDYVRQRAAAETAADTARFAAQKTELAEKDRSLKGTPYEADPLFRYLWQRRYGTAEYRANPLTRLLDGWVAKLSGYRAAAANYTMLLEIPRRLAEHAERLRIALEAEAGRLRALEEAALERGDSGLHRRELREARVALEDCEDRIEAAEQESSRLADARNTLARGDDEVTREALAAIESAARGSALRELRQAALGTPIKEDDAAVRRLEAIDGERQQVQAALENQKTIQLAHQRRLAELEQVRREYRRGGYGHDAWDFQSSDMLSVLLGEMLRGAITRDVFWDGMRRYQRPIPSDLGGGSFQWPSSGGGGFGFPDSFGGGGFRTGGGF